MPQQLIYTSAPRGIVAGRSGHCTVARSAAMREALVLQLEKFCYYQHLSLGGGRDRPIFTCRVIDIRGTRFHVLGRLRDAGLDFTGRTNFIAHHLVFAPEEIRRFPIPPVILRDWPDWMNSWTAEPRLLQNEDWTQLTALAGKSYAPAQTWRRVTGDAVNGYGLLEARPGSFFRADDQTDETVLGLFAESLELLEIRDPRKDFRAAAWQHTFTTSMQEQDNPADFRWRCVHSDNPAANRLAPPDCRALSEVRAAKTTAEETDFARSGRQAPRFVVEPRDCALIEGGTARLQVKAEGVPNPSYQWFAVDRSGNGDMIPGETGPELTMANPPLGVSRYVARAGNSSGEAASRAATLSVEPKLRLAQGGLVLSPADPARTGAVHIRSEEQIESQRLRLEAEEAAEEARKRKLRNKVLFGLLAILIVGAGVLLSRFSKSSRDNAGSLPQTASNAAPTAQVAATIPSNPPTTIGAGLAGSSLAHTEGTAAGKPRAYLDEANNLISPWTSSVVGKILVAPSAETHGGRFDLKGAGLIREARDDFYFVCRSASNSSEFEARISDSSIKSNYGLSGIMMRDSLDRGASFAFIGTSLGQLFYVNRSVSDGIAVRLFQMSMSPPISVKLARGNDTFTASYSTSSKYPIKDSDWTSVATNRLKMRSNNFLVGFALSSGDTNTLAQADFDNISFRPIDSK